jgi:AraC family transcriptional regulator of arabinose operon
MKPATQSHSSVAEGGNGHTFARNGNGTNSANMTTRCLVGRSPRPTAETGKPGTHQWLARKPFASIRSGNGAVSGPRRREFFPLAAGRSEAAAGLPAHAASENEIVMFYCIKGRGWCEIEGERHELAPGQLLIFPAKLERSYATYGERLWSLIWIQLTETIKDVFAVKLNVNPHTIALGASERAQMLGLFQDVLQALEMPCQQRLQQVSQRAIHILEGALSNPIESSHIETNAADKIGRTVEYMKEHLNEPLRAATLAGIASMSLPHYFAQFKRVTGSSPIDYLIKLRMDHARRLLSETSWSVKEVAVSLGYEDPLYFSRVFKSINQTAPTNFRARKRNSNGG